MLIKYWMSKSLITIDQDDKMNTAIKLMKENQIGHIPVTKNGKLTGMVKKSDIYKAQPSKATGLDIYELNYLLNNMKVKEIMVKDPVTVAIEDTIDHAAEMMFEHNVTCLPVVDGNHVIGIITQGDIFRVLVEFTGVRLGGIEIGVRIKDEPGSVRVVADIIRDHNSRIVSILTSSSGEAKGFRQAHFRVLGIDSMDRLKDDVSKACDLLYIFDTAKKKLYFEKE